jgi:hypothetical protein
MSEKLRALLVEARAWVGHNLDCSTAVCNECALSARIDAALAEPPDTERSPLYPGEGTWSVFAEKVMAERDEARVEIERLNALLNGVVGACKYACNRESHCGVCAIAFKGISP